MTLNRNSWHYHLACVYGQGYYGKRVDFCTYVGDMLGGCLRLTFAFVLYTVFSLFLWDTVMFLWFWFQNNDVEPRAPAQLALIFLTACATVAIAGLVVLGLLTLWEARPTRSSPGIVREVYRGWKEKFCPLVEFK